MKGKLFTVLCLALSLAGCGSGVSHPAGPAAATPAVAVVSYTGDLPYVLGPGVTPISVQSPETGWISAEITRNQVFSGKENLSDLSERKYAAFTVSSPTTKISVEALQPCIPGPGHIHSVWHSAGLEEVTAEITINTLQVCP